MITARRVPATPDTSPGDEVTAEIWEGRAISEWRTLWGGAFDLEGESDPGELDRELNSVGSGHGRQILRIYEKAGSTNTIARRLAENGAPSGSVVIADLQTVGRGRGGRPWLAPGGSALLLSVVLRPPAPLGADDAPGALPLRVGLAFARAVDEVAGTDLRLKWPNDLQVEGEKVGGILCEASLTSGRGGYIIAGVGLNVAQARTELPDSIGQPATSLRIATGRTFDRGLLAGSIIAAVAEIGDRMIRPLDPSTLSELASRDPLLGGLLTIDGDPGGEASGISPDGALLIRRDDGRIIHLRNGTVRLVPRDHHIIDG
jgi:BirA family biotin operon repressor/biotin-[acetyl-CoA-carboxylase] ligase